MRTITETKKVFTTLNELTENLSGQHSAQELINERVYLINEGWSSIAYSSELKEEIINLIVETLGGRNSTKSAIRNVLRYSKPQHWGLSRILLVQYENSPPRLSYCAGQDYVSETNTIRRYLSK